MMIMNMKRVFRLLVLVLILAAGQVMAQPGYKIDVKIAGLKDTTAFLGFYYGEQTYLKDTARVNSEGFFSFDGARPLSQGVYFLVMNKTRLFEFVVSEDQRFMLETDQADYIKNMKVTGDEDNRLFFENMLFNMARHEEADPLVKVLRDSTASETARKDAQEKFKAINEKVLAHQNEVISQHPETLTARLLASTKQIEVPEPPKKADGSVDSTFQFHYYRDHYFDYFDLSDDALIRLPKPTYAEKVKDYLDRLFVQNPDTLMKAIDKLVAQVKKNQETYKYLVWTCVIHYQSHPVMGLDEVYVRLFDKYIATGEMDFWLDKKVKQNVKEYVDKVRLSLVGNTAPNLIMQDQNFQPKALYDIKKKYTVLWIFDPDCGHCREETPKLVDFYNKNKTKYDLEVYAVSADTSMQKMRNYIKEMKMNWVTVNGPRTYVGHYSKLYHADTTPTMYIIDEKRKIIGKKIPVESLDDFLQKYEKYNRKQPNGNKGT
ncbi:MAG: redoxin domain-containing protein [Bacteroidota bacterium]